MTLDLVLRAFAIGIGATLLTDLWNLFIKRVFGIPSLNFCLLGRWILYMPDGTFRHSRITATTAKAFECAAGWIAHYTIGVVLAVAFAVIVSGEWFAQPSMLSALLYGIGTALFPLFILQPSLGLGPASSRTASPIQARLKSLGTHTVFGLGLYVCALGVRCALLVRG